MTKYLVIYEKTASGYSAYVRDLPGCIATAASKKAIEKSSYECIQFHLEGLKEEKLPIPKPLAESEMMVFE